MAIVTTDNQYYSDIAAAIRAKRGVSTKYTPAQMAGAISGIQTGTPSKVKTGYFNFPAQTGAGTYQKYTVNVGFVADYFSLYMSNDLTHNGADYLNQVTVDFTLNTRGRVFLRTKYVDPSPNYEFLVYRNGNNVVIYAINADTLGAVVANPFQFRAVKLGT